MPQALGCGDEQLVSRLVAEGVVYDLEIIQVEEQDGDGFRVAVGAGQGVSKPVREQGAIRKIG
jgi:hypothetical protein